MLEQVEVLHFVPMGHQQIYLHHLVEVLLLWVHGQDLLLLVVVI
jgi:hypothetical protein